MNSENETFKKLKGLTLEEAEVLYQRLWTECAIELELSGIGTEASGIPVPMIRERFNKEAKPYGWDYDKLFPWHNLGGTHTHSET